MFPPVLICWTLLSIHQISTNFNIFRVCAPTQCRLASSEIKGNKNRKTFATKTGYVFSQTILVLKLFLKKLIGFVKC